MPNVLHPEPLLLTSTRMAVAAGFLMPRMQSKAPGFLQSPDSAELTWLIRAPGIRRPGLLFAFPAFLIMIRCWRGTTILNSMLQLADPTTHWPSPTYCSAARVSQIPRLLRLASTLDRSIPSCQLLHDLPGKCRPELPMDRRLAVMPRRINALALLQQEPRPRPLPCPAGTGWSGALSLQGSLPAA